MKVHAQDSKSTAYCTELNGFLTRVNEFSVKRQAFGLFIHVTSNVVFSFVSMILVIACKDKEKKITPSSRAARIKLFL